MTYLNVYQIEENASPLTPVTPGPHLSRLDCTNLTQVLQGHKRGIGAGIHKGGQSVGGQSFGWCAQRHFQCRKWGKVSHIVGESHPSSLQAWTPDHEFSFWAGDDLLE
jgi:hypothetical protein